MLHQIYTKKQISVGFGQSFLASSKSSTNFSLKIEYLHYSFHEFSTYCLHLTVLLHLKNKNSTAKAMSLNEKYEIVVGLEIHIQLKTNSKLFAPDINQFTHDPNVNVSYITLGYPGVLPKTNQKAIEMAIKMGLATNCSINQNCYFDRKNYFYPDLPKGFQTTQDNEPICKTGFIVLNDEKIRINRIHIEEDAGKSTHDLYDNDSAIDLNRAGTPLLELVTEPDIHNAETAKSFVALIRQTAQYIDVCDGNMQEGSLRCDANVSVRLKGSNVLNNRVEIKNLNSLKNIKKAIEYEAALQMKALENGETTAQQTKGFDAKTNKTLPQRDKEMAFDYRYFPEPDLAPIEIKDDWLNEIKETLPILPQAAKALLTNEYELNDYNAGLISAEKSSFDYFLETAELTKNYKAIANWLSGPIKSYQNDNNIALKELKLRPQDLADIITNVDQNSAINSLNLQKNTDTENINAVIKKVLNEMPNKVTAYKNGRKGLLGLFVGSVMKQSKTADPKLVNKILIEKLNE